MTLAEFQQSEAFKAGVARAVASVPEGVNIGNIDMAKIGPCPKCGLPTRRLSVPVGGAGLDLRFTDEAWCKACLQAGCVAAADEVRARRGGG